MRLGWVWRAKVEGGEEVGFEGRMACALRDLGGKFIRVGVEVFYVPGVNFADDERIAQRDVHHNALLLQ
jgi:hypothetical protein